MAPSDRSGRGRSTTSRNEILAREAATDSYTAGRTSRRPSENPQPSSSPSASEKSRPKIERWTLGILNDKETEEVPGTVLLLSSNRNEPLGLEHQHVGRRSSSMPPQPLSPRPPSATPKKKTKDGQMILDPQPDDSLNDPLNWPAWRRDCSLLSLGFYCMVGGGMTPILAAGFDNVAHSFNVTYSQVALTTGLYMMGLGVGSVIFSPTAILFGKRPVYLGSAILFILTSVWCALAPSYAQLATARVFQGISVSPVECLPSATIAEIFFLHERAFRVGIYTLLLLGGKNLVPLVSAAIIDTLGWRWVFWIVAFIAGFGFCILFLFVPETFWDRTPRPKSKRPTSHRSFANMIHHPLHHTKSDGLQSAPSDQEAMEAAIEKCMTPRQHMLHEQNAHARFEVDSDKESILGSGDPRAPMANMDDPFIEPEKREKPETSSPLAVTDGDDQKPAEEESSPAENSVTRPSPAALPKKKVKPTGLTMPPPPDLSQNFKPARLTMPPPPELSQSFKPTGLAMPPATNLNRKFLPTALEIPPPPELNSWNAPWDGTMNGKPAKLPIDLTGSNSTLPDQDKSGAVAAKNVPHLHNLNSPYYVELEKSADYLGHHDVPEPQHDIPEEPRSETTRAGTPSTIRGKAYSPLDLERSASLDQGGSVHSIARYTTTLRQSPPKSYMETLRPWNGRLSRCNWFLAALRPFILFVYPSVLWSTMVYSLSVGWLIVLSESISDIYRSRDRYNFSALGAGLIYISPFVGGILGTAVAGKVSDIIVRYMARKNGGVYEPEFRLVMAIPVAISTAIGLMGFGWSAEERDAWIVPTVFFGIISFGCSLGSTTAITFCVDSYRQFAGEALVTLNFSKNIFHGLVFSLFFANWLHDDGPKTTFLAIGGIQLACMLLTIPMYIYGKRARMWTVRRGFMERF